MKKRMIAFVMMIVMCLSVMASAKGATAATGKKISYEQFVVEEGEYYSFRNAASGWYMNVKHAGKSNGTQLNLYPLDTSKPRTQTFKITVKNATKKMVQISPETTSSKYVDVRRAGKPFAAGQGICIWAQDGDPVKNLVLDVQEDGSFYLCFAEYPDYCIGAKDVKSASTTQTQLVVRKKTNAAELRWYLCDADGVDVRGRDIEQEKESWDNPYYRDIEKDAEGNEINKGFGQSYITIFKYYPETLKNEIFFNATDSYLETCKNAIGNCDVSALAPLLKKYKECVTCKETVERMLEKFVQKNQVVTKDAIEDYETAVDEYLTALSSTLSYAKTKATNVTTKAAIQTALDGLEDTVTYKNYIRLCISNLPSVVGKMDTLVDLLDRTIFTASRESCSTGSHAECPKAISNCRLTKIIEQEWFKDMFGTLNVYQFPLLSENVNNFSYTGSTCFGFACFAEWYINAEDESSYVDTERIATGTYTKEFIQKNVQPGDALRIRGTGTPHSVIVYAVEEDGIEVIDCNRALEGYGSSVVQKSKISYERYAGRTVWVDRVKRNTKQ